MFIPSDYEEVRDKWEADEGKGSCGPTVLALAFKCNVQEVIDNWSGEYIGWANVKDIVRELEKRGAKVKRHKGNRAKVFSLPDEEKVAIARVQWEGEWGHWVEAQRHTHFVFIVKPMQDIWVFCNGVGWFQANNEYLKEGHITSLLTWKY